MDRTELAEFLRARREAIQPEDVGLPRTSRRRTGGLRREEVAVLSSMSTDYYTRIEQRRGPRPSEQMLGAIARGLRLSADERDHLFRLAGHAVPARLPRAGRVSPGILRIFERLDDTPAQIVDQRGESLAQNRLSKRLLGDQTRHTGLDRSLAYRWFTHSGERNRVPAEDQAEHSRTLTAQLLSAHTRNTADPGVTGLVGKLLERSPEFEALWSERPVSGPYCAPKRIEHPRAGLITVYGQSLGDPGRSQVLTVFTARPGSDDEDRLRLLSVPGEQFA